MLPDRRQVAGQGDGGPGSQEGDGGSFQVIVSRSSNVKERGNVLVVCLREKRWFLCFL